MIKAEIGDTLVGDGATEIGKGRVIALTPRGDFIVEVKERTSFTSPNIQEGSLYQINKEWEFYSNENGSDFFKVGTSYQQSESYWTKKEIATVVEVFTVDDPAWPSASDYAVVKVTNNLDSKAYLELFDRDEWDDESWIEVK